MGKSPIPIIIDPKNRINTNSKILKNNIKLFHFIDNKSKINNKFSKQINFENSLHNILETLHRDKINSILVEGGKKTIQKFINSNLWDEARYFVGKKKIQNGIKAPIIKNKKWTKKNISRDLLYTTINHLAKRL
jgi:diaminohydroxyphosphoribosylaminopyrimidine deaminase/5-amino-6-(5-phosphoribosylamino)uracil reductase